MTEQKKAKAALKARRKDIPVAQLLRRKAAASQGGVSGRPRKKARAAETPGNPPQDMSADLYRTAPLGLCAFDKELRFVHINERLAKINGLPVEEHLGRRIGELVPDVAAGVEAQLRHVLETGELIDGGTVDAETEAYPGVKRTFQHSYYAIRCDAGTIVGVGCVVEDITERRRAEEILRGNEDRLRAVIETAVDALIIIDSKGTTQLCNPACLRMFGYELEELIGQDVSILMEAPHRAAHDNYLKRYREGGEARIIGTGRELTARRKDGSIFPMELSVGETRQGDGSFFVGVIRDITERKRSEENLRRQALIFEQMSDGVLVTDLEGRIIDWNPGAERMFGYAKHEVLGKTPGILHRPEEAESLTARIIDGMQRDGRWIAEIDFIRKDGTGGVCETSMVPLHDENGVLVATIGVNRDVSERKEMERVSRILQAHVEQSQKIDALGTIAGGIAHDFNNSLFPIMGLTELTMAKLPSHSKEYDNLAKVLMASHHARDLVQQILAFSREEPPQRQPVEIRRMINQALGFLRAGLPTTIQLRERFGQTDGLVLADSTQIQQVIVNLGTNARDAMTQGGGVITVDLDRVWIGPGPETPHCDVEPGRYFRLKISDTGSGMDRKTMERVFEPFFTTKPVGQGTGLGLSVAHGIVKNHDGAITVVSEPGYGTTFVVFLPVSKGRMDVAKSDRSEPRADDDQACPTARG